MKTYKALSVVNLSSGVVALSSDQYRRRKHNLGVKAAVGWPIVNEIQFKIGETFGYDGVIGKSEVSGVSVVKSPTKPKPLLTKVKL